MLFLRASAAALGMAAVTGFLALGCSGGGHSSSGSFASTAATQPATTQSSSPGSTAVAPAPTYGTRHCYPIVLVHGFSGFRQLGPLEYWYHIPETLRAAGYEVYVVQDKPYATIAERAQEMASQVLAQYPDPRTKVNLVGHSMGGLDSRYAVSQIPGFANKVASVTTIGTPHRGSSVADVILGVIPGPTQTLLNICTNVVGWNIQGGGDDLTTVYCDQVFNPSTPDAPGVAYFSWAGHADPIGATGCVIEPALIPSWSILENLEGDNDGLVSITSAKWGTFMGVVNADHMNEVGQLAGATTFDWLKFFSDWADQLEARGFGP